MSLFNSRLLRFFTRFFVHYNDLFFNKIVIHDLSEENMQF